VPSAEVESRPDTPSGVATRGGVRAVGCGLEARSAGNFNAALAAGTGATAVAGVGPTDTLNVGAAIGNGANADSEGSGNAAFALGTKAQAGAAGTGNLAVAVGNPGPNPGLAVGAQPISLPSASRSTTANALGTFNRAFSVGDGSLAIAVGGNVFGPPTSIGNNTALTFGNGAGSYAGTVPPLVGNNAPNNQFAFAGPGKNAVNTVNP
jgi:hypothetical protein